MLAQQHYLVASQPELKVISTTEFLRLPIVSSGGNSFLAAISSHVFGIYEIVFSQADSQPFERKLIRKFISPSQINCYGCYTINHELIVFCGGLDGKIYRWNSKTGEVIPSSMLLLDNGPVPVTSCWSGLVDGKVWILAGYEDGFVRLWDVETQRVIGASRGDKEAIISCGLYIDKQYYPVLIFCTPSKIQFQCKAKPLKSIEYKNTICGYYHQGVVTSQLTYCQASSFLETEPLLFNEKNRINSFAIPEACYLFCITYKDKNGRNILVSVHRNQETAGSVNICCWIEDHANSELIFQQTLQLTEKLRNKETWVSGILLNAENPAENREILLLGSALGLLWVEVNISDKKFNIAEILAPSKATNSITCSAMNSGDQEVKIVTGTDDGRIELYHALTFLCSQSSLFLEPPTQQKFFNSSTLASVRCRASNPVAGCAIYEELTSKTPVILVGYEDQRLYSYCNTGSENWMVNYKVGSSGQDDIGMKIAGCFVYQEGGKEMVVVSGYAFTTNFYDNRLKLCKVFYDGGRYTQFSACKISDKTHLFAIKREHGIICWPIGDDNLPQFNDPVVLNLAGVAITCYATYIERGVVSVIAGDVHGCLYYWSNHRENNVIHLIGHKSSITCCLVYRLPNGKLEMMSGSKDGSLRRWSLMTRTQISAPILSTQTVISLHHDPKRNEIFAVTANSIYKISFEKIGIIKAENL